MCGSRFIRNLLGAENHERTGLAGRYYLERKSLRDTTDLKSGASLSHKGLVPQCFFGNLFCRLHLLPFPGE